MAVIPPFFMNCVVAIGSRNLDGSVQWIASGFLYGKHLEGTKGEDARYRTYLVTNRHVIEPLTDIVIRMNPKGKEPAAELNEPVNDNGGIRKWEFHPDDSIDIAVVAINVDHDNIKELERSFFESDKHVATISTIADLDISEGNPIATLGFPMALVGDVRNAVVSRGGIVARIRDLINGFSKSFLVDSTVLPGNSGGPVVSLPELTAITGTKNQDRAFLIGIVAEYLAYSEIAISAQTKRPRIVFEENSGLSRVFPVDAIMQTIDQYEKIHLTSESANATNVDGGPTPMSFTSNPG